MGMFSPQLPPRRKRPTYRSPSRTLFRIALYWCASGPDRSWHTSDYRTVRLYEMDRGELRLRYVVRWKE